uniref:Uncharacterized protein n=1 Tax=Anguilla anguilla TaxID=7936 RepID=A0A0E9TJS1_ANGAN
MSGLGLALALYICIWMTQFLEGRPPSHVFRSFSVKYIFHNI